MSTLYGRKPSDTFSALLKMNRVGDSTATGSDPGITNTLAVVEDGLGNSTPLKLSSTTVAINEMLWPTVAGAQNTVLTVGTGNQLSWSEISSSNVTEGTNQYFTQARARASLSAGSGITYTAATGVISAAVTSVNSKTGAISLTTGDIGEGINQYFTQARARASIGVSGDLAYNATTGVISFTATAAPVTSVFGRTGAVTLNSLDVTTALGYTPVDVAQKNIPGGFAGLDATGKVPFSITGNAETATNVEWSGILNKPTTLTTYGITDAYPLAGLQTGTVKLPTAVVYESIVPAVTQTIDLGSPALRFRGIYVDEAYLSMNTLYLGDTPVMGTDQDTVNIKADPNQSITVKTTGNGLTSLISEKGVSISTSGMNSDVVVQASGSGSKVRFGSSQTIDLTSPEVMVYGNETVSGNSSVGGNLTVTGNLVVNGSQFTVNSTTVSTKDNIIVVNSGEVGSGVTSGRAGIQVDRGELADYQILFDEVDDLFKVGMVGQLETIASRPWATTNFAPVSHQHGDADLTAISWSKVTGKPTNLSGYGITDAQPLDGDLTAIAGLVETTGFLKKTATNTWALDTNDYLTGNQTVTISGDATGSGSTAIALTLANSGVTAGTYTASTVDAKGRVTAGANMTITGDVSGTAFGASIAVALTATGVTAGTYTASTVDAKGRVTNGSNLSVTGDVTGTASGSSVALTLANSGVTAGTYNNSATSVTPITVDAKGRVTGTGAAVTITPAFSSITGKPTTLAGYGITDAISTNGTLPMTNADIGSSAYTSSLVATGQIIDSVSATTYRAVKYLVQATSGSDYAVTEILLIHNGTTVTITEYGNVRTNQATNFVQYDADISGGNIRLLAQTFNASTTFKVVKTMIDA